MGKSMGKSTQLAKSSREAWVRVNFSCKDLNKEFLLLNVQGLRLEITDAVLRRRRIFILESVILAKKSSTSFSCSMFATR